MPRVNVLFVLLAAVAISGCEKYALDRQMEELCKKDGGVRIFEHVKLPANRFDEHGNLKRVTVESGYREAGNQ